MAMAASCTITNNTGSTILITECSQVNDDATWSAPHPGSRYENGQSFTISMGNDSAPFAPRGVGFSLGFVCQANFEAGGIYFDDPAVGEHHFAYGNTGVFSYPTSNPGGNSYDVDIRLA